MAAPRSPTRILVSTVSDDDTSAAFLFNTGAGGSTIIKVVDTDRTPGNNNPDTLSIDLLTLTLAANTVPATTDAIFQVAWHAPVGVAIGSAAATDPDAGPDTHLQHPPRKRSRPLLHHSGRHPASRCGHPSGSGPFTLIVVCHRQRLTRARQLRHRHGQRGGACHRYGHF